MPKAATHMRDKQLMTWTLGWVSTTAVMKLFPPDSSIPRGRRESRDGILIRHRKSQNPHASPHGNNAVNDDEEETTLEWDNPQTV